MRSRQRVGEVKYWFTTTASCPWDNSKSLLWWRFDECDGDGDGDKGDVGDESLTLVSRTGGMFAGRGVGGVV